VDWFTWSPVVKGLCTLEGLKTICTLTDVIDMHNVIAELALMEKDAHANR